MTLQSTLRPANGKELSFTGTSARTTIPSDGSTVGLYADQDVYIKLGDSTVVASSGDHDMLIPAGLNRDIQTGGATDISAIQKSAAGTLNVNAWLKSAL